MTKELKKSKSVREKKVTKSISIPQKQEEVLGVDKISIPTIYCKKLHKNAKLPQRAHSTDAGLDLFALEDFEIKKNERRMVRTGIALSIPIGYVGEIEEKSGLGSKKGLERVGGIVDSGYQNEILVILKNPRGYLLDEKGNKKFNETIQFKAGEKIAQIVIKKILLGDVIEVEDFNGKTDRGLTGFGDSGSK